MRKRVKENHLAWGPNAARQPYTCTALYEKASPGLRELSLKFPRMADSLSMGSLSCWQHKAEKFEIQTSPFDQRCRCTNAIEKERKEKRREENGKLDERGREGELGWWQNGEQ